MANTRKKSEAKADEGQDYTRPERHSRSVLLHGYGGAALRVFGTYVVGGEGEPRKIVVRAYHRDSAKAPWQPSDASVHNTVEELEEEIKDWAVRATALGYKRLVKRQAHGEFTKESIPVPPKPKPGVFTKGGMPGPLSVKHGGGRGR